MIVVQPAFSAAVRTLTGLGTAISYPTTIATTLAGAASVDLRPGAGLGGITSTAFITGVGAAAAIVAQLTDGSSPIQIASTAAAANSAAFVQANNSNLVGLRLLNNDATHGGTYNVSSVQWNA